MKLRKALNRNKFSGFQLCIKYWHYGSYRRVIWQAQRKHKELVEPAVNYHLKISLSTVREGEFNLEVFWEEIPYYRRSNKLIKISKRRVRKDRVTLHMKVRISGGGRIV